MNINKISFPQPVLGVADDVEGQLSFNFNVQLSPDEIVLNVDVKLTNVSLQQLVDKEELAFCLEIQCPETFFRQSEFFFDKHKKITLPSDKLRGKVSVNLYLISMKNIKDYRLETFNQDYLGYHFEISKGEVLGIGGSGYFMAEKSWADFMSVSSFMEIQQGDYKQGPVKYDLEQDKIVIWLSKMDYKKYQQVYRDDNLANVFHTAIAYPALIYVLSYIISSKDFQYDEKSWYLHLRQRSRNEKNLKDISEWEIHEVADIAQQLLKNPLDRTLSGIEEIYEIINLTQES